MGADLQRNLTLLVPLVALAVVVAGLAVRRTPPSSYAVAGAALGGLLALGGVLAVEAVTDWWTFAPGPTLVAGIPAETALGWAVVWGVLPGLLGGPWWLWVLGLAWVDLLVVPRLSPLVDLGRTWLVGELVVLLLVAVPAVALARLTRGQRLLGVRVVLQAATFGMLVLVLLPTLALDRTGGSWAAVAEHPAPVRVALLAAASTCGVLALAAVAELARVGRGTPFPWDPAERLVVTGPYAYLANPMQVGATGLLVVLAAATGSVGLLAGAALSVVFSEVLAERHEQHVLGLRWPEHATYRRHVRRWWPRWRPAVLGPTTLWVSRDCPVCRATGSAVLRTHPVGLQVRAAEDAGTRLTRARWAGSGTHDRGVAAVLRSLEQTVLPVAWACWALRLPGVGTVVQAVADGCGLGPRPVRTGTTEAV